MTKVAKLKFERFPAILRTKRHAGNYTLQTVADGVGLSKQFISLLEGGWANPSRETLFKLADFFDCEAWELTGVEYE